MTEKQVLERLLARDDGILALVEAEWGPSAAALARRILQSPQDAEECLQDGLMALWDTVPPLQPDSLRAYFLSLVRNRALDVYRAERREKRGGGVVPLALEELGDMAWQLLLHVPLWICLARFIWVLLMWSDST